MDRDQIMDALIWVRMVGAKMLYMVLQRNVDRLRYVLRSTVTVVKSKFMELFKYALAPFIWAQMFGFGSKMSKQNETVQKRWRGFGEYRRLK